MMYEIETPGGETLNIPGDQVRWLITGTILALGMPVENATTYAAMAVDELLTAGHTSIDTGNGSLYEIRTR